MISSHHFGHQIFWDNVNEQWVYEDGTKKNNHRSCPKCGKIKTKEGHDPCLSKLPGVKNACCGHGIKEGYLQFIDGTIIRFNITEIERNNL